MHSNQKCPWRWMIQERKTELWWLCGEAAWLLCNIWNTLVMSGGRRLEVSLRREIELWQRPPVTAIRVLKFWRARSFYSGESRGDERGVWDRASQFLTKTKPRNQNKTHFCDVRSLFQFTCATWMNLVKTWALCWAVCLLRIISWTHWETPLHIMTDRSSAGLSLTEPRTT